VLDINRPLNDEYAVGIGLQNNLENTLKKIRHQEARNYEGKQVFNDRHGTLDQNFK
jgi:hypothetical protein